MIKKKRYDVAVLRNGVFTEIANYVIENGGCVVGAKYADNHLVEHSIIFEKDDIGLLRQSKICAEQFRKYI